MTQTLSDAEIIDRLKDDCLAAGGVISWSKRNAISFGFVYDVLRGNRSPASPSILAALGLQSITTVVPINTGPDAA